MLGKLFKYEGLAAARILLPLYGAIVLLTGMTIGFFHILPKNAGITLPTALFIITTALFVLGLIEVCIVTFCLSLVRFYKNLLSDEGYLTHTLPVSTGSKLFVHIAVSVFWMTVSILLVCVLLFLFFFSIDPEQTIRFVSQIIQDLQAEMNPSKAIAMLEMIPLYLLSVVTLFLQFFTALAVGAGIGSGKHKILNAVLVYLVIYVVRNIVGTMILLIPPLTFTMTDTGFGVYISEFAAANLVLGAVMIYELVFCAVYYCLIYFSMKKHLNL